MKRDAISLPLDLGYERIADNFAGGGGASEALRQAFGRHPDIAINHDGEALAMHEANHPTTRHYREDVFLIDPRRVIGDGPLGAVWFSPTCTHFSRAKGFNILNQKTRGLAWVVLRWAVSLAPRLMFLENVEEFQTWGPLDEHGRPVKAHKGRTFDAFVKALTTGLPPDHPDLAEIRETLGEEFPIERIHTGLGYKVEWRVLRACDYGAPTIRKRLFMVMRRDGITIRWPDPTHGDPDSPEVKAGKLLPFRTAAECIDWSIKCPSIFDRKKPLKPNTLRRVGRGFERYVKNAVRPYIVDTAHGELASTGAKRWGSGAHSIDAPMGTITASGQSAALVAPIVVPVTHQGSDNRAVPIDSPLPTVTCANRGEMALVTASLVQYYKSGSQNLPADRPMPTIVTKDRIGVTTACLVKHYGGHESPGWPLDNPMSTVTTQDHHGLVTAHLVAIDNKSNNNGAYDVADPLGTIVTENRYAVTTCNLVKLRGTSSAAAVDEPLATVSAGGQHHAEVRTTLAPPGQYEERREQVRAFLREYCPSLRDAEQPELVMINGELMEVVDIGLRMLVARELANAQGFPPGYKLDPFYTYVNKRGRTVTKRLPGHAQVRMIGNSVSPPPAIALIRANNEHERYLARAA